MKAAIATSSISGVGSFVVMRCSAMPGARIYDLDSEPIATKRWTELENVRATWEFFQSHKDEFK